MKMDRTLLRWRGKVYRTFYIGSKGITLQLNLAGTAGTFVFSDLMKVPEGQVWVIRSLVRDDTTSSSAILIFDYQNNTSVRITPQSVNPTNIYTDITIFPGDIVGMRSTANALDSVRSLELIVDVFYLILV